MRWALSIALVAMMFVAAPAVARPRISITEARKVALARVPGTIVHEKLKKKKPTHDVYNFKIVPLANPKKFFVEKVSVDGDTGKILKIKQVQDKRAREPAKARKPARDDDDAEED